MTDYEIKLPGELLSSLMTVNGGAILGHSSGGTMRSRAA